MQLISSPRLIDKENIPNLRFPDDDVLTNNSDRKRRMQDLLNANELGDLAQYKVKILFEDNSGPKKVETTIWKTTDDDVVLKYGIKIPIRRVVKIYFP